MPVWNKSNSCYYKRCLSCFLAIGLFFFMPRAYAGPKDDNFFRLRKVVIDAGHGGQDPGALGKHYKEKDIVLGVALKLGKYIQDHFPDVEVIYTRSTDTFIPLHERAEIANRNKADLFISIHANSAQNKNVAGTETYVMGLNKDESNFDVARKENSVIVLEKDYNTHYEGFDPNSAESYIIFTLMQNAYLDQSLKFAALVQEEVRERGKRCDRGVKQAGFLVLWRTSMPSVLVETGYITNPTEENYLHSQEGQSYIASSIFRAFRDYKRSVESRSQFRTNETGTDSMTASVVRIDTPVVFKVQITAARNQISLASDFFQKMKQKFPDVTIEEVQAEGIYKYLAGSDSTYQGILPVSQKIKQEFPGAFVVALKGKKFIPLKEALNFNK